MSSRVQSTVWSSAAPRPLRWVLALVATGAITWFGYDVVPPDALPVETLSALVVALVLPVFRVIVELGASVPSVDAPARASGSPVVTGIGALLLMGVIWLAVPAMVLAHNCPAAEDGKDCKQKDGAALLATGAAIAATGGAYGATGFGFKPKEKRLPTQEERAAQTKNDTTPAWKDTWNSIKSFFGK